MVSLSNHQRISNCLPLDKLGTNGSGTCGTLLLWVETYEQMDNPPAPEHNPVADEGLTQSVADRCQTEGGCMVPLQTR